MHLYTFRQGQNLLADVRNRVLLVKKIVPSGYMSLMRHGLLVRLKYVEIVSVFTA